MRTALTSDATLNIDAGAVAKEKKAPKQKTPLQKEVLEATYKREHHNCLTDQHGFQPAPVAWLQPARASLQSALEQPEFLFRSEPQPDRGASSRARREDPAHGEGGSGAICSSTDMI